MLDDEPLKSNKANMTNTKVKYINAVKSKKLNTVMFDLTNNYPENSDILKKPVGKTHKCIYMLRGIKDKKNIKNQKKNKKAYRA